MSERRLRSITRGTKKYVKQAIQETGSDNIYDICEQMSSTLEETFVGDTLDYQLREDRMDLATTSKIMDAIETYMYNYLSSDDRKRIQEGEEQRNEIKAYVKEQGINVDNLRMFAKKDADEFTRRLKRVERVMINTTSTEEDKAKAQKELESAIEDLKNTIK